MRCVAGTRSAALGSTLLSDRALRVALATVRISDQRGEPVQNPLFRDLTGSGALVRQPFDRFLAGIVSVPWQDIATDETLNDPTRLEFLTALELNAKNRWAVFLGIARGLKPTDALMWETTEDRTTLAAPSHPITGDPLAPSASGSLSNPINGHEYLTEGGDLQYACIFPLGEPRDCSGAPGACQCSASARSKNDPLCTGTLQTHAKAYPGLRQLDVLRGLGDNAVVASTCPKIANPQNPDHGYAPAMNALVDRMSEVLGQPCNLRTLGVDRSGRVTDCTMIEVATGSGKCDRCEAAPGRKALDARLLAATTTHLEKSGACGVAGKPDCCAVCACELEQLSGEISQSVRTSSAHRARPAGATSTERRASATRSSSHAALRNSRVGRASWE